MDGVTIFAHLMLGHAAEDDRSGCLICVYAFDPTPEHRHALEQVFASRIATKITTTGLNIVLPDNKEGTDAR
jgi:hypothetical protein